MEKEVKEDKGNKKKDKVAYVCVDCDAKFTVKYTGWHPTMTCIKCGGTAKMADIANIFGKSNFYAKKSYKEPVAFFKDNKGRIYGVDKKGRKFLPDETRYDLKRDPHGWKAVGYKVRPYDERGRPNI